MTTTLIWLLEHVVLVCLVGLVACALAIMAGGKPADRESAE